MVPNEAAIFLPFRLFEIAFDDAGVLARDQRQRGVGAELGGVAAVVAERHEVHAAQHGADHRHADLHDVALAGLQRVERIDAGRVGPRDGDVEPCFSKKPRSSAIGRPIWSMPVTMPAFSLIGVCACAAAAQRRRRAAPTNIRLHPHSFLQWLDRSAPNRAGRRRSGPFSSRCVVRSALSWCPTCGRISGKTWT